MKVEGGELLLMLRAAVIALVTFILSVTLAGALVFGTAFGQTATTSPTLTTSPSATVAPSPTGSVQADKVIPSGAPNTGHGGI
jgi:hypothetical protein